MGIVIPLRRPSLIMSESRWDGFYSIDAVSRLTLIPLSTLRRWRRDGIIGPSIIVGDPEKPEAEGYSYADVTVIRMVRAIRQDRFDFHTAAIALWHLCERFGPPREWRDAKVYFTDKYVFAEQPDTWSVTEATQRGQATMTDLFGDLFEQLRASEQAGDILIPAQFREWVSIDPDVMSGEPVVRGTRAPTSLFVALRRKGHSVARICRVYSMIPRKFIEKAIEYEEYVERALSPNGSTLRPA